ncbi:MAG: HigA family addiction module antidote protein [Candidatus Delongbacteria bacterium]|nr:HigA family addiction module antidote protein [Candidatus Delongbacteria bacterium]
MKNRIEEPQESMLTQRMDVGSQGFNDFQVILLSKSRKRTESQKMGVDLLSIKYEMEDYLISDKSEVKPVGEFLKTILKTLKIQQKQFAEYLDLKPSNLSKLINGERTINYDLALIFGRLFNHNPMLWIEIQAKNELKKLLRAKSKNYSVYSLTDLIREQKNEV